MALNILTIPAILAECERLFPTVSIFTVSVRLVYISILLNGAQLTELAGKMTTLSHLFCFLYVILSDYSLDGSFQPDCGV